MLSTLADVAWERSARPARAVLAAELRQIDAIVAGRRGDVALVADEPNAARQVFLGLRGRPSDMLVGPAQNLAAIPLADVDTLVVSGDHRIPEGWMTVFDGRSLLVLGRAAPPHLDISSGEALGSGAVSG